MNLTPSHRGVHFIVVLLESTISGTRVKLGLSMRFQIKERSGYRSQ